MACWSTTRACTPTTTRSRALAVEHLVKHGHRRIAMIRTDDTSGTVWSADVERTRAYVDTVKKRRLAHDL